MGECSQDAIRIMVVDDEPIIADELSELLKNHLQDYGTSPCARLTMRLLC